MILFQFKANGFETSPVHMKISFGKDKTAWNNHGKEYETELVKRLRPEIQRFGNVLKWVSRFEFIFIFVPISKLLKLTRFSDDFSNYMVYPLTALFFGTGNQTPSVSSAIIARVFLDPDLRLFDYDSSYFLSQTPEMFAFDNLENIYKKISENSNVKSFYNRSVIQIKRQNNKVIVIDDKNKEEIFDEIIFACDAETCLKILGNQATFLERKVLGNVRYYNDITVTHQDLDYMKKYYEMDFNRNDQYFIRIDPNEPENIDMSFNLSNYQPQLVNNKKHLEKKENFIFQTIFLNDKNSRLCNK